MTIRQAACCIAITCLAWSGSACGQPSMPNPASPSFAPSFAPTDQFATVSGTVWLHASDGVKPFVTSRLFGWVETGRAGHTTGAVATDANGNYSISVPHGSRIRIYAGTGFSEVDAVYQPCEVTAEIVGDVIRDVRVVTDRAQLGAQLPGQLTQETPTLSGTVVEVDRDGHRIPLNNVRVELDGLFGMGVVTATTLTDDYGRYILCGLSGEISTYLFASKAGYQLFETNANLNGNTTLDIELRR